MDYCKGQISQTRKQAEDLQVADFLSHRKVILSTTVPNSVDIVTKAVLYRAIIFRIARMKRTT